METIRALVPAFYFGLSDFGLFDFIYTASLTRFIAKKQFSVIHIFVLSYHSVDYTFLDTFILYPCSYAPHISDQVIPLYFSALRAASPLRRWPLRSVFLSNGD
jgi:hypothetical protein